MDDGPPSSYKSTWKSIGHFYVIPGDFSKHGEAPFEATGHLLFLLSTIWETRLEKHVEN